MILQPVWVQFHQSVNVVPPPVSIPTMLPSLVCATLVLLEVAASTLATPSLFPPSFIYLSAFAHSSYRDIASSSLSRKLLSAQVGFL